MEKMIQRIIKGRTTFYNMTWEGLSEEVTFKRRPRGSHGDQTKAVRYPGTSRCREVHGGQVAPDAGNFLSK